MRPASAFPPKRVGPPVRMEKKRAQIGTVERRICASDGLIRLSALNCKEKKTKKAQPRGLVSLSGPFVHSLALLME